MGLEISPVVGDREVELFLKVPAILRPEIRVNKVPGRWMRPVLDRRKNPYFRHSDHILLLARRDGRLVGRVGAFVDHLCNRTLEEKVGTFAMFDSVDSPRVAAQILEAAEQWLVKRGVDQVRGPCGPAMRLGTGLLVEGHGRAPMPGMTFDPPELGALIEGAGYEPARDLYAYRLSTEALPREVAQVADEARRREGLKLRNLRNAHFEEDIQAIQRVINDLPGLGRACAPWTTDEVRWMARKLWLILDRFLVLLVEQRGESAAVGFALRNVRELLGGRSPRGSLIDSLSVAKALRLHQLRSARITLLAVRPRFDGRMDPSQGGDLAAMVLSELLGRLRLLGVQWAELSLVDPTDLTLVELMEACKAEVYKTYRIYQKPLR
jgi:hypothetical protein